MKWFFIILLLANLIYLGWEIDRDLKSRRAGINTSVKIPAGTPRLSLLAELKSTPEKRPQTKTEDKNPAETFNSEPVLPIELNPNTKQMIHTLLTDSSKVNASRGNLPELTSGMSTSDINGTNAEIVCYTYGPIPDIKESELLSNWLKERDISYRKRETDEQGKQLFWVYLAPQVSRVKAEATLKDLKNKGIQDLRLIREGDLLNAISLGLFSSQASVNKRLHEIKAKGYRAVVVPYGGGKKVHWFDVSVVQNSSYIDDLFTGFPARFNAAPAGCNQIAIDRRNP